MTEPILLHKSSILPNIGCRVRVLFSGDHNHSPVDYVHRDDYFIFGIVVHGVMHCAIDFKKYRLTKGEVLFIRPGQVHQFISSDDFIGWMLMADTSLIDDKYRRVFEEAVILGLPVKVSSSEAENFKSLFMLIHNAYNAEADISVIRHLVAAYIGMFAGLYRRLNTENHLYSNRQLEIVLSFRKLLDTDISKSHGPSHYASLLHISPVYFNEVVKKVSGMSAGNYIRNEIILRAKRYLYHTSMTVKEISLSLGFEDNAYFTRLFTRATGQSPTQFRRKH